MKKTLLLVIASIMLFASACGTTTGGDTSVQDGGKSFNYSRGADPVTLDAAKSNDNMSAIALYYTQTFLMRDEGDVAAYDGAESFEISEDGLTVTVKLRDGLVWPDGEPITSENYAFTLLRTIAPETGNIGASSFYPIKGAEAYNMGEGPVTDVGVSTPDDKTLVVELAYLAPTFYAEVRGLSPIRQDVYEQYGESYGSSAEAYMSSGPFVLTSWEYEQGLEFVKNENFWNAAEVKLTDFSWATVMDPNAQINLFEAGEIDFFDPRSEDTIAEYANSQVVEAPQGGGNFLQFNFSNPDNPEASRVLANRNFRMALSHAIDRQAIVKAVMPFYEADTRLVQPTTPTVDGVWGDSYEQSLNPVNADPEKAKEYLAAALEELDIASVDDLPTFNFIHFDSPTYRSYSEAFLDAWESVLGITSVEINILPIPQAIQTGMQGKFDIFIAGLTRTTDPYNFYEMVADGGAANWGTWDGMEEFTEMLMATNSILDPKERQDALFECEKFFDEHGFVIPLWSYGTKSLVREGINITGYTSSVYSSVTFQFVYADITSNDER